MPTGYVHPPAIVEALNADIQADLDHTMASRRRAVDVMLSISTQCSIHHAIYSHKPGDAVLMIAQRPMSTRQARNRALFAGYLLRDVRSNFFANVSDQAVRVSLIGMDGKRMAATVVQPNRPLRYEVVESPYCVM